MAKEDLRKIQEYLDNCMFVDSFIRDVLAYTLPICGLPASSLPKKDCTENIYRRTDFLKTAGASVLRLSLVKRDDWKRMFKSRRNSSGLSDENIHKFIEDVVAFHCRGRTYPMSSVLEIFLAVFNEIILYLHFENIDIDVGNTLSELSMRIALETGLNRNDSEKLDALFDSFDDISGYTEWITYFISRFAIPYGSRDDVSVIFFECVRKKFKEDVKKLTDSFRFLPHDHFSAITAGISGNSVELTSIRRAGQSPEPPNLGMDSESKFLGSRLIHAENTSEPLSQKVISKLEQRVAGESSKNLEKTIPVSTWTDSENVSEHLSANKPNSEISSELGIKQNLEKGSLDVEETHQETQGAKTKHKMSKKGKGIGRKKVSEILVEWASKQSVRKSLEPPKLPIDSDMGDVERKASENFSESTSISSDSKTFEPEYFSKDSEINAVRGKQSGSLAESTLKQSDRKSVEQQKLTPDYEIGKNSETVAKSTSIQSDSKADEP